MIPLASTPVHFVWQGAVVALAAAVLLRFGPRSPSARYLFGVVALGAMLAAPIATFVTVSRVEAPAISFGAVVPPATVAVDAGAGTEGPAESVEPPGDQTTFAPFVVVAWALGVLLLSIRLLGGWIVARRVARAVVGGPPAEVLAIAATLCHRLGLTRMVTVVESSACAVPAVIGWLRPVVLLPVAALSGLPPAHIQAVLAHELAHVRRHDYLVNLLQTMVETLLFYHPGVWWVSRQVRIEREHCCDDLAVSVCDRLEYATALSSLAAMSSAPVLALAATDGSLVSRVRRLLGDASSPRSAISVWSSVVAVAALVVAIPVATVALADRPSAEPVAQALPLQAGAPVAVAETVAQTTAENPEPGAAVARAVSVRAATRLQEPERAAAATTSTDTDTEAALNARLEAAARQLRSLELERMALERRTAVEQAQFARQELVARRDRLRSAHAAAKTQFEIGQISGPDFDQMAAALTAADNAISRFDLETKAQQAAAELERQKQITQDSLEQLRARLGAAQARRSPAQSTRTQTGVIVVTVGAFRGSFGPRSQPYTQGGPAVFFPVADTNGARTSDGRRISQIRFTGWREGSATRVMAIASVPRDGAPDTYTTDASRLVERDAGTYLIEFGQMVELEDLEALGIPDIWISSVAPAR